MDCLEYIYNIYKLFEHFVEELNNESTNILNEYSGLDD